MFFDILSLFPGMFEGPFSESIIGRARREGLLDIDIIDIRDYTRDKHNTADDYPYGGGAGMVLKIEPIYRALQHLKKKRDRETPVILLTPQGRPLTQELVKDYSCLDGLTLICGHYEGVDERIREHLITEEVSIGDFVLTGGELPAMVLVDSIARLVPGVLGDEDSVRQDSFYNGLLEYPHYTRPREFKGMKVPDILLSGDHGRVDRWRQKQSLKRTWLRRPDLLKNRQLTPEQKQLLAEIKGETNG
ncbi:MAG: tRNA (guanosine(37)-N1)-methyltransferase TrmD [Bacillota bacterium]